MTHDLDDAAQLGQYRGEVHAAFADAYGGALVPDESDVYVPEEYDAIQRSYYLAAFLDAAQMYEDGMYDDEDA